MYSSNQCYVLWTLFPACVSVSQHETMHEDMRACVCAFVSACVCVLHENPSGLEADHQVVMRPCYGRTAGTHGPAVFQDEAQDLSSPIQILTVGHSAGQDSDAEVQSKTVSQAQSKQDLRVTMLKKGTRLTACSHSEKPVEDKCHCRDLRCRNQ